MSKKNVALFIDAVAKKKDLNTQLSTATPDVSAWTAVANGAGFEFSADDLHAVLQKVLGRQVEASAIIPEFITAQSEAEAGGSEPSGAATRGASAGPSRITVAPITIQKINDLAGIGAAAGEWGLHVKGPFGGSTPGGNQQR